MDIFYEESAINQKAKSREKVCLVLNIFSKVFYVLAVLCLMIGIVNIPVCSPESLEGVDMEAYAFTKFLFITCIFFAVLFGFSGFYLSYIRRIINVSYDYAFVSGELRISKVFNTTRRKLVARIDCNDMIQIGNVDSASYDRCRLSPDTREVVCTPNKEAAEGKSFVYILAAHNGKTLFVLECRDLLLVNIFKFAKRSVLASDYTSKKA